MRIKALIQDRLRIQEDNAVRYAAWEDRKMQMASVGAIEELEGLLEFIAEDEKKPESSNRISKTGVTA